jgi:hypothetical protein
VGCPLWWEDGSAVCSAITLSQSYFMAKDRSVSRYALVSNPLWDLWLPVRRLLSYFCGVPSKSNQNYFTTDGQSVCLGIKHPCGTCDQILLPVGRLLSESCGLVSVGHPLWWKDGCATCSAITQWSELRRTRNHTLMSYLSLPQPRGSGFRFYISQKVTLRLTVSRSVCLGA